MKTIIMACGLPRSGKTSFRNKLLNEKANIFTISADELRYLVHGERFNSKAEDVVWFIRSKIFEYILQQKKNVFVDETNTSAKRRKPIIELAKRFNYKIICVYFDISKEICIERAKFVNDEDIIPIINKMHAQFEPPEKEEGIDEILHIANDFNVEVELFTKSIARGLANELKS